MKKDAKIEVSAIKKMVNHYLEHAESSPEQRKAVSELLSCILLKTDQYRGFNYLAWINGGVDIWRADGEPEGPEKEKYFGDQTKIVFY